MHVQVPSNVPVAVPVAQVVGSSSASSMPTTTIPVQPMRTIIRDAVVIGSTHQQRMYHVFFALFLLYVPFTFSDSSVLFRICCSSAPSSSFRSAPLSQRIPRPAEAAAANSYSAQETRERRDTIVAKAVADLRSYPSGRCVGSHILFRKSREGHRFLRGSEDHHLSCHTLFGREVLAMRRT